MEDDKTKMRILIGMPAEPEQEREWLELTPDMAAIVATQETEAVDKKGNRKVRTAFWQWPQDDFYTVQAVRRIAVQLQHDPPDQFTVLGNIIIKTLDESMDMLKELIKEIREHPEDDEVIEA
jgi:hypothetical protein